MAYDGKGPGKMLAVAIRAVPSSGKKKPEERDDEGEKKKDDDGPMGLESAMSAFAKAVESGDSKAMAKAFRTAQGICGDYEG